jgi:hypothetical protein
MARGRRAGFKPNAGVKTWTYESMFELAEAATQGHTGYNSDYGPRDYDWCLGADFKDALELAKFGWSAELPAALEIAESAVTLTQKEHLTDTFLPVWDVTGAEVDVARYLSGEPECMIDYPLSKTSKAGKVVTLVSSCTYSAGIEAQKILERGRLIVALALVLEQTGHSVEIWASCNITGHYGGTMEALVKVKGADDVLDPAVAMFALAHPAMLRRIMFAVGEGYKGAWKDGAAGRVLKPRAESFPEGSIIIPDVLWGRDIDPEGFLRKHLGDLGLLAE